MIAILVDPSPEGFRLRRGAARSVCCSFWVLSLCSFIPCFVADSSRRTHANSLPVGFCSSDAGVLLQRATSKSAGATEPDADAFVLPTYQRPDGNRAVIFGCSHWPSGRAPRERGPAIFKRSFPTNRNATDRSAGGSCPGQVAHSHRSGQQGSSGTRRGRILQLGGNSFRRQAIGAQPAGNDARVTDLLATG